MVLEWFRYANAALAVVAVALMVVRFRLWRDLPASWRVACLGFGALVVTTGYGTVEVIAAHAAPGSRVPLITVALIWVIHGLRRADRLNTTPTRGDD